jgi:uncharacterized protein YjbJ (UPF0337 family)
VGGAAGGVAVLSVPVGIVRAIRARAERDARIETTLVDHEKVIGEIKEWGKKIDDRMLENAQTLGEIKAGVADIKEGLQDLRAEWRARREPSRRISEI